MAAGKSRFLLMMLGIVGVGATILVLGLFVFQQQSSKNIELKAKSKARAAEVLDIQTELEQRDTLVLKLDGLKENLASLDSSLADYKYMPTYLKQLQKTAADTDNILQVIQPEKIEPLDPRKMPFAQTALGDAAADTTAATPLYRMQRINLTVRGNFVSLMRMLNALRSFPKMVYVRTINMAPISEGLNTNLVTRIETIAIITPDQYLKSPNAPVKKAAEVTQ